MTSTARTSILALSAAAVSLACGLWLRARYERAQFTSNLPSTALQADAGESVAVLDSGIQPGEYFRTVQDLLEQMFYKEIDNPSVLSHGALDFMLQQLNDPGSRFFSPDVWNAIAGEQNGTRPGIGADLILTSYPLGTQTIYSLKVLSVLPMSAASAAGLNPDDEISAVNDKWLASAPLVKRWQSDRADYESKKITIQDLQKKFEEFQARVVASISFADAMSRIYSGTPNPLKLKVFRDGKFIDLQIVRPTAPSDIVVTDGETIRIHSFADGCVSQLKAALAGRPNVILDLRGNPGGPIANVTDCLALLIPAGKFGFIRTEPKAANQELTLSSGNPHPPKITVWVDKGTSREAELFTVALRDKAHAEIKGGPTRGFGVSIDRVTMRDGAGYTITNGHLFDLFGRTLVIEPEQKTAMLFDLNSIGFPRWIA